MEKIRKSILNIFSAIMILSTFSINSFSQKEDKVIDRISSQFQKSHATYPQEKIYIDLDKPFYTPGETIWYKAYLVNAAGNIPSSSSGIIYVELLDDEEKVIIRQILTAVDGFANGAFLLPAPSIGENYLVRAYTNWMRNFNPEYFFIKQIQIFNQDKLSNDLDKNRSEKVIPTKSENKKIDMQFFPEGGHLVSGLESKVAFKAINSAREGIATTPTTRTSR